MPVQKYVSVSRSGTGGDTARSEDVAGVDQVARWRALQRFARTPRVRRATPDSGDLLLGLADVPGSVAARALAHLGVTIDALQAAVERQRDDTRDDGA
jgi:Clp amino terminal domain, pathogenicity island component